ncbi:hypothetical protein GCM10012275_56100 [Longimycelium tulufanense]|uniref:Uncharacterized protein n=1 Tax=Longimycelium tulufanense TaxID=907463 RepID=A0A8J3CHI7_9PSEU|nr:hypothetical protein [Longimycelium tulufanense]GGM78234.1 hypothetical protein GCM10012275_56100 [Longimycelium tulufanense]
MRSSDVVHSLGATAFHQSEGLLVSAVVETSFWFTPTQQERDVECTVVLPRVGRHRRRREVGRSGAIRRVMRLDDHLLCWKRIDGRRR